MERKIVCPALYLSIIAAIKKVCRLRFLASKYLRGNGGYMRHRAITKPPVYFATLGICALFVGADSGVFSEFWRIGSL